MTIRNKLILWYSGLLAVIIIVFGIALFSLTRWVLVNSVDVTLDETANQVLKNSRALPLRQFGSEYGIGILLPELDVFRASGVVVQVWELGDAPRLAGASSNLGSYDQPIDPASLDYEQTLYLTEADGEFPGSLYSNVRVNDGEWRVLTRPIEVWGRRIVIQTATPFDTVTEAGRGLLIMIIISTVIALIGSVGLGMVLANRALKPIDNLTQAAARITAADDLKTRLKWDGPQDELGRLTSIFNQTMERLEHLFSVQQRFVADVSHELRTPLTAISGHLELIKRYGMDPESLDAIESETQRMSRLVSDLLLLAKADYGGLKLERQPLDLDTIVSEVYRESRVLLTDRDLKFTIDAFEPVRINGDADRLKQLLLNLVSNAIKFTPDGGRVVMSLRKSGGDALLDVQDTGIGMEAEDARRIFDRFYQADSSRVRHHKSEGSGLGLSIAKWIAEAHDGSISVESEPGVGTTFTVRIPHIDTVLTTESHAITRPRLGLIRRGIPPIGQHRIKP